MQRAYQYWWKSQHDLALADCNKAIEIDPVNGLAYLLRGQIYVAQKKVALAVADFNKVIEVSKVQSLIDNAKSYLKQIGQ